MKKIAPLLLVVAMVLLVLVVGYILVKMIFFGGFKQALLGTWTTEDGDEKLVIRMGYLIYTDKSVDIKETRFYITKHFDLEDKTLYLYPTTFNKMGMLGSFQKIEFSGNRLIGDLLISDMGVVFTEFRKEW